MSKPSKKLITFFVVLAALAGVLALKFFVLPPADDEVDLPKPTARSKGNVSAEVHIQEFIDFQCPACARGAKYLNKVMKAHPDLIYLEMKYFPLASIHKHAIKSASYAQCAARQELFWPFHDRLIDRQDQWKKLINATPAFDLIAQDVGLDLESLKNCLIDDSIVEEIDRDKLDGRVLGVRSTPTYFVNKDIIVGAKSLAGKLQTYGITLRP